MKKKRRSTGYVVYSIAAAALLLTAQFSLGGSATWLLSPQDSAWENANNWTPGGPPNGPSDVATFVSHGFVNISTSEEVNSIVYTSDAFNVNLSIVENGQLIISGKGVTNNNNYWQTFYIEGGVISFNNSAVASVSMRIDSWNSHTPPYNGGLTIFNDTSSAGGTRIVNEISVGAYPVPSSQVIFNDASTADHATIINSTAGQTTFNDVSTAANATITNDIDSKTIFNGSSTADNASLAAGGLFGGVGTILFNGASTGGTARVWVRRDGSLDISGHQSGVTIGSIGGPGNVFLGANRLTVGANNINTSFSGVISGSGSLAKVGSGILTLRANDCIAETVGLILVTGSIIKLDFAGPPDVIASLKVDGVLQPPGIYGGPMSRASHILPEFGDGPGTVEAGPISTLGNISTRAFVQMGDNVMIGGFIVEGAEPKRIVVRAIGPELTQYGVPNALANPTLELHDSTGALIASNDNWQHTIVGGVITSDQVAAIGASGYAPSDLREPAMIVNLPRGNYTAIVRGVANMTGVGLVEVYDLSPAPNSILSNISSRSFVHTGDNVMIGGVIVQGTQPRRVIVRAIGPELTQYGVPNPLADPTLKLYDSTGALIASNDNWQHTIVGGIITNDQVPDIRNSGYAPGDRTESAIIATLPPGNYTAIVRGVNNMTGVALVEVYDLDQ